MKNARLLRIVLVVGLLAPAVVRAQDDAAATQYEQALAQLDQLMAGVEELRAQIDPSRFNVEELTFRLGFEAEAILAFMREEIAFEQYPGLLRGPRGTLIGRAGNALDQAVLLATLLLQAGYEARIARGQLSPEQARSLIDQMAVPRKPEPPVADPETLRTILTEMGRTAGMPEEEIARQIDEVLNPPPLESSELYQEAQEDTEFILTMLEDAGVTLGDPNAEATLIEEARDYFWVEYRLQPTESWASAHPAFKVEGSAPEALTVTEYHADPQAMPEDLHHRFRFQVFIEQKDEQALTVHPVMDPWEASTVDLVGVPLTYFNYPHGVIGQSDTVDSILDNTRFFGPMVNDDFAPGASAFEMTGDVHRISRVSGGAYEAEITAFEGISDATGDVLAGAGEMLTGEEAPEPPALTAQWIEFTFVAPDGEETIYRRTILDRIGVTNRQANLVVIADGDNPAMAKAALVQHQTFALAPGEYSSAFVLDHALRRFLAARPLIEHALAQRAFPDQTSSLPPGEGLSSAWAGRLAIFAMFDVGATTADTVTYRAVPSLVVYQIGLASRPGEESTLVARTSVDVVRNERRAFVIAGDAVKPMPERLVWIGAWETHAEAAAVSDDLDADPFTTMVALDQATAASIPVRVVTSNDALTSGDLELGPDALANLQRDLTSGYVVLVPERMLPGAGMTGWWRVDPRTGETLGMTSDGRGQSAEYVILLTTATVGSQFAFVGCFFYSVSAGNTVGQSLLDGANCGSVVAGVALAVGAKWKFMVLGGTLGFTLAVIGAVLVFLDVFIVE